MGTQETVGQGFVFAEQSQQQVLGLNIRRAELAGFIPRKKDDAPCFFRITLEHIAPVLFRRTEGQRFDLSPRTAVPSSRYGQPASLIIVGQHLFCHWYPLPKEPKLIIAIPSLNRNHCVRINFGTFSLLISVALIGIPFGSAQGRPYSARVSGITSSILPLSSRNTRLQRRAKPMLCVAIREES